MKTIIREMKIGNEENHWREMKNKQKRQDKKKIIREMNEKAKRNRK